MKIESIRLKNFKAFRDVRLKDIPAFLVVVGPTVRARPRCLRCSVFCTIV